MTNDSMKRYVKFISNEIGLMDGDKLTTKELNVSLPRFVPKKGGGYDRLYVKMGLSAYIKATVEPLEILSRSLKIRINFEKYSVETIYFMSRHKSPDELIGWFNRKIGDIVEKKIIDEGRQEDVIKWYNETQERFTNRLKEAIKKVDDDK